MYICLTEDYLWDAILVTWCNIGRPIDSVIFLTLWTENTTNQWVQMKAFNQDLLILSEGQSMIIMKGSRHAWSWSNSWIIYSLFKGIRQKDGHVASYGLLKRLLKPQWSSPVTPSPNIFKTVLPRSQTQEPTVANHFENTAPTYWEATFCELYWIVITSLGGCCGDTDKYITLFLIVCDLSSHFIVLHFMDCTLQLQDKINSFCLVTFSDLHMTARQKSSYKN